MFERYTDRARRVLFFARYEAGQLGSRLVEPEHLLLGLVRESSGVAGRIFASVRIALEDIRGEIENQIGRNERVADMAELPIGPGAQQALESAATEADRFGDRDVNAEHLLLGILQDEDSVAASVLNARGLQLDAVRAQIFELRREHSTESPAPSVLYSDPSDEVRIAPTRRTESEGTSWGGDRRRWTAEGARLKDLLWRVCDVMESRIVLPAALDDEQRYDVALILPHDEHGDQMHRRIREGIEKHFQVSISSEACATDVLVLTAPNGITEAAASIDGGVGGAGFVATGAAAVDFQFPTLGDRPPTEEEIRKMGIELLKSVAAGRPGAFFSMTGISLSNGTMADFCEQLERGSGRPVVDETNLDGRYDLHAFTESPTTDALFDVLREKFGLVVTPARREVAMLVVRAR